MPDAPPPTSPSADPLRDRLERFLSASDAVLVGQRPLVGRLLIALATGGHVLLEGVPGLAKTTVVRTVARALALQFRRVQFTPDLLPADLIGTQIYHPSTGTFAVRPGPVFANVILADEINRAPAKVQSALLEAMQERQITIGEETLMLPDPFFVLATQNPIEQEGTYPLPEAQLDRFMFKLVVGYPSRADELTILDRRAGVGAAPELAAGLSAADLAEFRAAVDRVHLAEPVRGYLVDLVRATRHPAEYGLDLAGLIEYGAGPRATLALARGARAHAYLAGRGYATPDDVKTLAPDVLRHRVVVSYEAEAGETTPDQLIRRVLDHIPVP